MNLFDRWLNSSRILRSPDDGSGSAAAAPAPAPAADATAASTTAPAADASSAPNTAPAPDTSAAPAASSEAPAAATESASSLLGAAEAKLPGGDAGKTSSDQDSASTDKGDATAKPATDAAKPDAAKDAAKDGASAPADEALAAKPQAKTYDAFKAPDGVKFDDAQVKSFTDLLDNTELSHQDRAQKLIDMHAGEINRVIQEQRDHQLKVWSDFTDSLKSDFKKDPELGGNRQETSLGIAKYVLEQMGGSADQQKDLIGMMNHTGMGNHLGLIRMLNNVYERFLAQPSPVPGQAPNQATRGNFQDVMYGQGR